MERIKKPKSKLCKKQGELEEESSDLYDYNPDSDHPLIEKRTKQKKIRKC
ncbi:hypothetical protein HN587_05130 [Candidatus Woesearchaeota archaeon]|mgnify:CR=1 FL=1|jgi:hypothetical protein|nr:hypothetical protein [Candidatus Woesearchaeota archaeon]